MKCTKIYNARSQLLSCSLINLLFGDVPVAVAVVVCLSSLISVPRSEQFSESVARGKLRASRNR